MRTLIVILIVLLTSCSDDSPNPIPKDEFRIVFAEDVRHNLASFEPSVNEISMFEVDLLKHLQKRTEEGKGFQRNVLEETHPLEYSLGWFKRRYFGRIDENGARKIFAEFVFVRCGGSDKWEDINYPTEDNNECWWSVEYDIENQQIEQIKYP